MGKRTKKVGTICALNMKNNLIDHPIMPTRGKKFPNFGFDSFKVGTTQEIDITCKHARHMSA